MGKRKQTTSTKVDPWMPSEDQWSTLTGRAGQMMTPEFRKAMTGAQGYLGKAGQVPTGGNGVQQTLMRAMSGGQMDGVADAITRQAPGIDSGFNRATERSMNSGLDRVVDLATRRRAAGPSSSAQSTMQGAMAAQLDGQFDQTTGRGGEVVMDRRFDEATGSAGRGVMDYLFDTATRKAQNPEYSAGFQKTMTDAQDPTARSAAFDQVKRNAVAEIMPDINSTFAGSGMTGSSLHQQNLAKGLMAGVANVENQAHERGLDRAMKAAETGQSALQTNREFGLKSASMRQDQADRQDAQSLKAAELRQGVVSDAQNRDLKAAGMRQDAQSTLLSKALQAAGMQSDASARQQSQDLQAAGLRQSAINAEEDRGLRGAGMRQDAASKSYSQALQAAGLRQGAFNSDRSAALQAAGMQGALSDTEFNRLLALANATQGAGGAYQNAYSGNLANMMSAATGGASRSSTQTQSPGLMGVLGTGLQIASLFSDRRLKTDIKRVGELDDGTPVYTYRYTFGGPIQMGVMADELEHLHPEAVATGADGLKRVNYGAI